MARCNNTDSKIAMELQLKKADYAHFGTLLHNCKIIDADIGIWIAPDFPPYILSLATGEYLYDGKVVKLFLIETDLIEIEGLDNPILTFKNAFNSSKNNNPLSKKNNPLKNTKSELSNIHEIQLKFWTKFKEKYSPANPKLVSGTPRARHYFYVYIGFSEVFLSLTVNTKNNTATCGLYIRDDKEMFDSLHAKKYSIEAAIGRDLDWRRMNRKKGSRVTTLTTFNLNNEDEWERGMEWLFEQAKTFREVFGSSIERLGYY